MLGKHLSSIALREWKQKVHCVFLMSKLSALGQLGISEAYDKIKQCSACYINYVATPTNDCIVI